MYSPIAITAALVAVVVAQDLDWHIITQLNPLPTATIPVVYKVSANAAAMTAVTLTYSENAILSSVAAAISVDPSDAVPLNPSIAKRATTTTTCIAQPLGSGPVPSPDSPSAFLTFSSLTSAASNAPVPSGYAKVFTNLQKSSNAYGYLGYTILKSYDTEGCAKKCTAIEGCQSFNIYFERDPSQNPDSPSCADPQGTTQIKCAFWGGPISSSNAKNGGQLRNKFHVVITGSNGYVNQSLDTPPGYAQGIYLNAASIKAPVDCNSNYTYIQHVMFNESVPFDPSLCAAACSSQNSWALSQHSSSFHPCKFFNTYILYKNGQALGQNCALYSQSWNATFADNTGYYNGNDHYTAGASYAFSNSTDPGTCKKQQSSSTTTSRSSTILTTSGVIVHPTTTTTTILPSTSTTSSTKSTLSTTTSLRPTSRSSATTSSSTTSTTTSATSSARSSTTSATTSSITSSTTSSITSSTTSSTKSSATTSSSSGLTTTTTSSFTTSTTSSSITTTTSTTTSSGTTTISITSSNPYAAPAFNTTTTLPAATVLDPKATPASSLTASCVLPTTTDINGIKPSATHAVNFEHENDDDTVFNFSANLTALETSTIVNMENFVPFIAGASCSTTQIQLKFTTEQALKMASGNWPSNFTLLTSDGVYCGSQNGGRTFYNVSSVSFDDPSLTATMSVVQANMTDVCSRITAEWGPTNNTSASQKRSSEKRGIEKDGSTTWNLNTDDFVSFVEGFAYGFDAGYNAIVDIDPHQIIDVLTVPNYISYNRITCPGCGLTATIQMYGSCDWNGNSHNGGYDSAKAGVYISNANFLVAFDVFAGQGYSASFSKGLSKIKIIDIGVPGFLGAALTASLEATAEFELATGGFNIMGLGVQYQQQSSMGFELDFIGRHTNNWGWRNLAPSWLNDPYIQNIPSALSLRASIGPAFGIDLDLFGLSASGEIGLDAPYFELDLSLKTDQDVSSCDSYKATQWDTTTALDVSVSAGFAIYADFSLDAIIVGNLFSKKVDILTQGWTIYETCFLFDSQAVDNLSWGPGFS